MKKFAIYLGFCLVGTFWASGSLVAQINNDYYQGVVAPSLYNQTFPVDSSSRQTATTATPRTATTTNGTATNGTTTNGTAKTGTTTNAAIPSAGPMTSIGTTSNGATANGTTTKPFHCEAVLFGMDDYSGANYSVAGKTFGSLGGCNNDVRLLTTGFLKILGVPYRQISILCDKPELFDDLAEPDDPLKIQAPTRENFIRELKRTAAVSCDRLIVSVSCHGMAANGKSFVMPQGMEPADFADVPSSETVAEIKSRKMIPIEEILTILRDAKAPEVLLLLDACRSFDSSETETGDDQSFMREFKDLLKKQDSFASKNSRSFAVITSCSFGESAEENDYFGTIDGKFIYHFVDGLLGMADCVACLDGYITMTEAYNYAFSRVAAESNHRQTPEIFMAPSSLNMSLIRYDNEKPTADDDDLAFLLKSGLLFVDSRNKNDVEFQTGVEALSCVLDNIPNNSLAYSVRGSGYRRLGDYEKSLSDLSRVGQKFQLFAKKNGRASLKLQKGTELISDEIADAALLTISKINGDWLFVTEIDNIPLNEKAGYLKRDFATWDAPRASGRITTTPTNRRLQSQSQPQAQPRMDISPGPRNNSGGNTVPSAGPMIRI